MLVQEIDLTQCACGVCMETSRFMESGFHRFGYFNSTIWTPRVGDTNSISLQVTGSSICVTHTKLEIRYSTYLFQGYNSLLNNLWWSGIGLAIFAGVIPIVLFGQAARMCKRRNTGAVEFVAEATPLLEEDFVQKKKK